MAWTWPNDPVDADGKLDFDQVQAIVLADLCHFLGQLADRPNFPVFVAKATGKHKLVLADFEILSSLPQRDPASETLIPIDRFDRGFTECIPPGAMNLM